MENTEPQTGAGAASPPLAQSHDPHPTQVILEVAPEDVEVDYELRDLREWRGGTTRQELTIPDLARSIVDNGQKQPAVVWQHDGKLMLVAGQRRREAVIWARDNGEADLMLRIVIDPDIRNTDDALIAALTENIQRENFTGIEYAKAIQLVRKRFGWPGGAQGTRAVADCFKVSPATILQKEKLLTASPEVQKALQAGRMSESAVLELLAAPDEAREEVGKAAADLAEKDAAKKAKKGAGKGAKVAKVSAAGGATADAPQSTPAPPAPAPRVEAKHVRQAKQRVGAKAGRSRAWKVGEMVDFFEPLTGPAYPKTMSALAGKLVERAHGKCGDRAVKACWDAIARDYRIYTGRMKAQAKARAGKPAARTRKAKSRK